jgi:hypothetical protein
MLVAGSRQYNNTESTTSCLSERAAAERTAGQAELPASILHQQQPATSYLRHESSRLSASVKVFLNQPVSAVQHGWSEVHY